MRGDTMKKSCPICGGKTTKTPAPATVQVGSHTFSSSLPAMKCQRCDEHFFAAADLEALRKPRKLARKIALTLEPV